MTEQQALEFAELMNQTCTARHDYKLERYVAVKFNEQGQALNDDPSKSDHFVVRMYWFGRTWVGGWELGNPNYNPEHLILV